MEVPDGVHVRNKHGELKDNLAVDYVMWVRDRHPRHFDHHHPTLGKLLEEAQAERGTQFLWFTSTRHKTTVAESIHAMVTPTASSSSVHAPVIDPSTTTKTVPEPTSAIIDSSGARLFPAPAATIVQSPHIALETLAPPTTPGVSDLPPPSGFNPPLVQEISSSSVVSSNIHAVPEILSGAPVPEPSSALLAFLFFGGAAVWRRSRFRGSRCDLRAGA
jgi:hypothetical protein